MFLSKVWNIEEASGRGSKVENTVLVERILRGSDSHLQHHTFVLVCLHLLIEGLLNETLLGQLLISSMIQYISHLVVIISKCLLLTNQ
jgi:hypothetical protein